MKSTSRQVTCPPGETNITDVVVNSTGTVLYSAAGNTVRIWDLRRYEIAHIFVILVQSLFPIDHRCYNMLKKMVKMSKISSF